MTPRSDPHTEARETLLDTVEYMQRHEQWQRSRELTAALAALAALERERADDNWIGNALSREIQMREAAEARVTQLEEPLREFVEWFNGVVADGGGGRDD